MIDTYACKELLFNSDKAKILKYILMTGHLFCKARLHLCPCCPPHNYAKGGKTVCLFPKTKMSVCVSTCE